MTLCIHPKAVITMGYIPKSQAFTKTDCNLLHLVSNYCLRGKSSTFLSHSIKFVNYELTVIITDSDFHRDPCGIDKMTLNERSYLLLV